jgi:hypothetical protein
MRWNVLRFGGWWMGGEGLERIGRIHHCGSTTCVKTLHKQQQL